MKPIELPLSLRVASSPPAHHGPVKRKEKEPEKPFPWDIIAGEHPPNSSLPVPIHAFSRLTIPDHVLTPHFSRSHPRHPLRYSTCSAALPARRPTSTCTCVLRRGLRLCGSASCVNMRRRLRSSAGFDVFLGELPPKVRTFPPDTYPRATNAPGAAAGMCAAPFCVPGAANPQVCCS